MPGLNLLRLRLILPALVFLLLGGCSSVNYYDQLVSGQLHLLAAREPVEDVIADPSRDPKLRQRLAQAQLALRSFSRFRALVVAPSPVAAPAALGQTRKRP